jgi:acyl-CoA thioester hydrolase
LSEGIITFAGIAHPWMCDAMGHLNVRHYVAMFDDASFQLLGRIAGVAADPARLGWADRRMEIDFEREVSAGALVTVRSRVERLGRSSLTYRHVLSGTLDGVARARAVTVTVRFDLAARRAVEIEAEARVRAEALMRADGDSGERH